MKTTVTLSKLAEDLNLRNLTPEIDMTTIELTSQEINRPALQLAGYFEHFSHERVQIIGYVEYTYILAKEEEEQHACFENFVSRGVPCVIFTALTEPTEDMRNTANKYGVPILLSERTTSSFMVEIIRYLGMELAPRLSMHGVLVDVYGEGVLILGESGIGKSEAALELVRRGHRLVSDDVVVVRKISDAELVGYAPDVTKHLIELRGIGIIDVKTLYGVEHVKDSQAIDLIIKLEDWKKDGEYDRLGLEEQTPEILGTKIVSHAIPIRPGRNRAVIVETAAVNHRQKKMGYNAAQELYRRVQDNIMNKRGN